MSELSRRRFLQSAPLVGAIAVPTARADEPKAAPLKFRVGIITYNIAKDWDLPTIIKVCQGVGLAAVELRTTHKHGVEPSLGSDARRQVKQRFAGSGVTFWGCGSTCEFQSQDRATVEKNIEECKRFLQLVADLGGHGVKVRPNGLPKQVPVEKTLEQIGRALVPCGKAAADLGLEVWVEVHGSGTQIPKNMKTIMDHCGLPNVGVTWNSNRTDVVNGSVAEAFALLRPHIKSCHINELWKDQTKLYPYRELFRLFREAGYDRYTLCEVGRAMPDVASGTELLRYYKALWTELAHG